MHRGPRLPKRRGLLQDALLTPEELAVRDEVREFVRTEVPADLLRRMDRDEIAYPRQFVEALGARNLLGLRFPREHGGRGASWRAELAALEEVGVLGTALGCAFAMPSIVGEALSTFGSEEQKRRFLQPMLRGELVSAEALTEPRGGSDFFGATTRAELKDGWFTVRGQKRFIVGAEGADFFLVYCSTNPGGSPHQRLSLLLVEKDRPLLNIYSVLDVNPTSGPRVNSAGGRAFAEFILGPEAQVAIKTFGIDKFGQALFVPIAGKTDTDR